VAVRITLFRRWASGTRQVGGGPFLSALAQSATVGNLGGCFPFRVLTARTPAHEFFDFYEI
jgi:hypothetical protein